MTHNFSSTQFVEALISRFLADRDQIHWMFLFISLIILLVLASMVIFILIRTLRKSVQLPDDVDALVWIKPIA